MLTEALARFLVLVVKGGWVVFLLAVLALGTYASYRCQWWPESGTGILVRPIEETEAPTEEAAVIEYAAWCRRESRTLEAMVDAGAGSSDVIEHSLTIFREQMPPEILQGFHGANIALLEQIKAGQQLNVDEVGQEVAELPSWVVVELVDGGCVD